jgi:hypothetical protein
MGTCIVQIEGAGRFSPENSGKTEYTGNVCIVRVAGFIVDSSVLELRGGQEVMNIQQVQRQPQD